MEGKQARQILSDNKINMNWLADQLGITPQALYSRFNARQFRQDYLREITEALGKDIFGLGAKKAEGQQPILDIRVCAGNGIGLDGDENSVLEYVQIPAFNGCFGITIYGDSMYPLYSPGDVVFVRQITSLQELDYGSTYIVITRSDRILKTVYESKKGAGYIRVSSYNANLNPAGDRIYPDYDLSFENILFLYKVVGSLHRTQL